MPRRRLLVFGFVVATATVVSPFSAALLAHQHAVTRVVALAREAACSGPFPAEVRFLGTIVVSGYPTTVEYRWERSDGTSGERQRLEICGAGEGVCETWRLGAPGKQLQVWDKLRVLAPRGLTSPPATVTVRCQ
jgi:hypothetical protein